ncbi:efflux RND transporter periplasmic adaptor subunit [Terricaulis sp.]|uniref:efflux RND transporter periplasmic adaptor subunit n=1 Tax=Terricaulis sp. TaxID=2768686 RepID=UPI00378331D1
MTLPVLTPPTDPRTEWRERARAVARRVSSLPVGKALAKVRPAQWFWIAAAAAVTIFFVWMTWPNAAPVEAALIDRGPVVQEVSDEGRTRIHDVFVIAAPLAGKLERVELEPGDAVERGDVVATVTPVDPALLDARVTAEARAGVAAAQAGVRAAEADLDLAQREQARVAQLARAGFASAAALDNANAGLSSARANALARRAELARARAAAGEGMSRQGAAARVRAPAAGRVLRLLQESETVVTPGAPLMEIGDPGELEVVAEFLSQDAAQMRPGARAFIENWGGGPIAARITRIEPYAHTKISALGVEEQRVNVILRLERPGGAPLLGHGFRVDVRVTTAEAQEALRVPVDALVRTGDGWSVFRIEHGRARLRPVRTGLGGDRYRVIEAGLESGDQVVLFPGDAMEDGARVRAVARRS